ncbi:MAG: hypothetical protein JJT94_14210 [Bernardetiaceae bacterium]|nr:hypothetical protein [Bernardetiaceae bacterium]
MSRDIIKKIKEIKEDIKEEEKYFYEMELFHHKMLSDIYEPVSKDEYDRSNQNKVKVRASFFILHKDKFKKSQSLTMLIGMHKFLKDYKQHQEMSTSIITHLKNKIKELEQELDNTTEK